MGVRGLTTFIEQYASSVRIPVSIPEMAARFRQGQKVDLPVLLVDGMALLRKLYQGALEWIYGGQWRQLVALIERFVAKFHSAGIKLIFIFDGSVESKKRMTWVQRRQQHQREIENMFEGIKRNHQQPLDKYFQLPSALATMVKFLLKYVCHCEVRNSLVDADLEIARMAKERPDCFAVLSEDTDFFIFDTKNYLSIKHLNLDTLRTVLYCRSTLAKVLRLDPFHFPLFASLMGNDVISFLDLRYFHRNITGSERPSFQFLPTSVSDFIAKLGNTVRDLNFVATVHLGISPNLLRESVSSYVLDDFRPPSSSDPRDQHFRQRHVFCLNCSQVYDVLVKREMGLAECLEDPPRTALGPSCLLLQPMRRRWYAFLTGTSVREWITYAHQPSSDPVEAKPLDFPMRAAADWSKLWSEEVDVEVENHRWDVFLSCVGVKLPQSQLRAMPPSMAVLAIILNYYLLNEKNLKDWEVHALLAQAISPLADDLPFLQKLTVNYVDERAVHIASLIMRALVTVLCVSQCCSEPLATREVMPWYFFDGKLFHYFYLQAKDGITLNQMYKNNRNLIGRHQEMFRIVTEGTHKATKMWTDQ